VFLVDLGDFAFNESGDSIWSTSVIYVVSLFTF